MADIHRHSWGLGPESITVPTGKTTTLVYRAAEDERLVALGLEDDVIDHFDVIEVQVHLNSYPVEKGSGQTGVILVASGGLLVRTGQCVRITFKNITRRERKLAATLILRRLKEGEIVADCSIKTWNVN